MTPSKCPAIRSYAASGIDFHSLHDVFFEGPLSVRSDAFRTGEGALVLVPGVIGSPGTHWVYARIDTGFSVEELPSSFLMTLPLELCERPNGYNSPSILYEKGYSGPLLAAIASAGMAELKVHDPIAHFVPLVEDRELQVRVIDRPIVHADFEGLLQQNWARWIYRGSFNPNQLWTIDHNDI